MPPAPLEPVAALNGRLIPLRQACVPVVDEGIVQGAIVTERIRTFARRPYLLTEHLQRLRDSLGSTGVAPPSLVDSLPPQIEAVVSENSRTVADWQDLAIVIFVTPGPHLGLADGLSLEPCPSVCVHTTVLPVPAWGRLVTGGVRLLTPSVRQIPPESLDPRIKHRSRLHWFVAQQQVHRQDPQAWALLLDGLGHVTETASGNLMIYDGARLLTPRAQGVLGGISQHVVRRLAAAAGIPTVEADLSVADVLNAREAFLTSTGYCLLPVTHLNGRAVGEGRPGPLIEVLLQAWSDEVGLDIMAQHRMALQQLAAGPKRS